jgi:hypothetical protein
MTIRRRFYATREWRYQKGIWGAFLHACVRRDEVDLGRKKGLLKASANPRVSPSLKNQPRWAISCKWSAFGKNQQL